MKTLVSNYSTQKKKQKLLKTEVLTLRTVYKKKKEMMNAVIQRNNVHSILIPPKYPHL